VAEAHEPALAGFDAAARSRARVDLADRLQHAHDLLVGAAVQRARQRAPTADAIAA
jgi:hypothetical protein